MDLYSVINNAKESEIEIKYPIDSFTIDELKDLPVIAEVEGMAVHITFINKKLSPCSVFADEKKQGYVIKDKLIDKLYSVFVFLKFSILCFLSFFSIYITFKVIDIMLLIFIKNYIWGALCASIVIPLYLLLCVAVVKNKGLKKILKFLLP